MNEYEAYWLMDFPLIIQYSSTVYRDHEGLRFLALKYPA